MRHKHLCPKCKIVWEHDANDFESSQEFHDAHNCPDCGERETWKYWGSKAPDYEHKKGVGLVYCSRKHIV